jgi:hypothetical protein
MADKQRLNSVERFRKKPERLVLEEHSHCEVPAGCGGVVLRWRNPTAVLPVTVHLYTPVKAICLLDGRKPETMRIDLAPGTHVVAVHIWDVDLSAGLVMFSATHDPKGYQDQLPAGVVERPMKVVSAADGTWKFTLVAPPDDWAALAFDDGAWAALVRIPTPNLERGDHGSYQARACADQGAACLGLPIPSAKKKLSSWWQRFLGRVPSSDAPPRGGVWIRKVFEVPAPEHRDPPA